MEPELTIAYSRTTTTPSVLSIDPGNHVVQPRLTGIANYIVNVSNDLQISESITHLLLLGVVEELAHIVASQNTSLDKYRQPIAVISTGALGRARRCARRWQLTGTMSRTPMLVCGFEG